MKELIWVLVIKLLTNWFQALDSFTPRHLSLRCFLRHSPTGHQPDAAAQDQVDRTELALAAQDARIASLESQLLSKDEQLGVAANQIGELHRLLAQTALNAAPARPWWRFWR